MYRCPTSKWTRRLQCQHQWTCTTWRHPRAPRCRPAARPSSAQSPSSAESFRTTTTTRCRKPRAPRATGKPTRSATPCWRSCLRWSRHRWRPPTTAQAAAPRSPERARRKVSIAARKWHFCLRKPHRGRQLWPFSTTTKMKIHFCRFWKLFLLSWSFCLIETLFIFAKKYI